ncbi:MAG TPA: hypothetical protein VIR63_01810 [Pontiella sp.]
MPMFPKYLSMVSLLLGVMLCGCVSRPLEPEHNPELGVAQGSDGIVTFVLETMVGYKYRILYQDPKSQTWKTLPGCVAIQGTGRAVEIRKSFNSRRALPSFTVKYSKL